MEYQGALTLTYLFIEDSSSTPLESSGHTTSYRSSMVAERSCVGLGRDGGGTRGKSGGPKKTQLCSYYQKIFQNYKKGLQITVICIQFVTYVGCLFGDFMIRSWVKWWEKVIIAVILKVQLSDVGIYINILYYIYVWLIVLSHNAYTKMYGIQKTRHRINWIE